MLIRAYRDEDKAAVRALFVRVDRVLAPEGLRAEFEDYIKQSLQEEINRIPAYYGERDGSFWVAEEARALVGMYGLERVDPQSAEVRRMYVARRPDGAALRGRCSTMPSASAARQVRRC